HQEGPCEGHLRRRLRRRCSRLEPEPPEPEGKPNSAPHLVRRSQPVAGVHLQVCPPPPKVPQRAPEVTPVRQSSVRPRHRAARPAPLRSMLTVTSAVAGATLIGLGAAGTTLALWQDSNPLNAPSIVSGSMDLKVEDADSYA